MNVREYLEIYKKGPCPKSDSEYHTHYEGEEEDYNKLVEYNKELCKKYPWLIPTNRWSGKKITDCADGEDGYWPGEPDVHPEYDWSYTELDSMPEGWRIAFGEQMCEEIQKALLHAQELNPNGGYEESYITTNYDSNKILSYVDGFRITEIKEKFGGLRFYCNAAPEEVYEIINKYENLSYETCIICGEPAKWITCGWISPYCDTCKKELENNEDFYDKFELINEENK